jgi:hypothetical protein
VRHVGFTILRYSTFSCRKLPGEKKRDNTLQTLVESFHLFRPIQHKMTTRTEQSYRVFLQIRVASRTFSEKCVVRRFSRCANVIECTYTNLDSIAYYTPRLYGIAYCS